MVSWFTSPRMRFSAVIEAFDWGPSVSRLVLDIGPDATALSLKPSDYSVWAFQRSIPGVREEAEKLSLRFPGSPFEGEPAVDSGAWRTVSRVYRADRDGSERERGRFLALELETGPSVACSSILRYDVFTVKNLPVNLEHTVTLPDGRVLGPDRALRPIMPVTDEFVRGCTFAFRDPEYGKVSIGYSRWSPPARRDPRPLIVWLHGAGEGGTDSLVALLGNPVTHLAGERVQSAIGGAHVLIPQCPTMWMDDGAGGYSDDGKTKYSRALMALIKRVVRDTPSVDPRRVYIGGCSNGGFMALRLILDNPGYFGAGFPACEAFRDDWIGDAELRILADTPLRFVCAKTDNTVPSAPYTERLYGRLVAAGARDAALFFPDAVVDPSGRYRDAEGRPFTYHCHFSWIYALNDACSFPDGKSLMEWLADHRREG